MSHDRPPLSIEVRRNCVAESIHRVHALVADRDGGITHTWGDAGLVTYPRSSLKPVQALPLIETGAAKRFGLCAKEIAFAASSHNAEPEHIALGKEWLEKTGLRESDLECGAHWPHHRADEHALCRNGQNPGNLHNNCSGKHLGMLSVCLHMDWPLEGYTSPGHPLQRLIFANLAELSGYAREKTVLGIDGCSAPTPALPLANIARAFSALLRREAGKEIIAAMGGHPFFVAGNGRFDTALMEASKGELVTKAGAEGNIVILHPRSGRVAYLKCEDGQGRASQVAAGVLLEDLGLMTAEVREAVAPYTHPVLKNWRGIAVGDIAPHQTPGALPA